MTKEQLKQEFTKWIDAERPDVWIKYKEEDDDWELMRVPCWNSHELYYIVNDKHATLRKLQVDEPDTKFQAFDTKEKDWYDCDPTWNIRCKYRAKPKEWYEDPNMVGKPIWVKDFKEEEWLLRTFENYEKDAECPFVEQGGINWRYAKPVKCEDLYQGGNK